MSSGSNYFSAHTHSQFSSLDGMTKVPELVRKAASYGQPAFGLTDHGTMAGTVQGYMAAKKEGIKFFPGLEGYLIDPTMDNWETPDKGQKVGRYHFGMLALNEEGYKAMVKFTSLTHTRPRFNRFPRATLSDIAELGTEHGENIALTTGCYFGYLQQTLVYEGMEKAEQVLGLYKQWFPHTFVELQNHGILHHDSSDILPEFREDDDIVAALWGLANDLDLPVIATQDSHYTDQKQKKSHALMKKMTYGGADDAFPGDSFHLASGEWVAEHYTDTVWDDVEDGFAQLLDLHDLRIKPLDTFKPDVPRMPGVKAPKMLVRRTVMAGLEEYLDDMGVGEGTKKHSLYWDRLAYELGVIEALGMSSYFVIWQKFAEWCRDEGIAIEARGSANGSLVCFILRITQIDPIIWGVDFDRFLSKDRIKPPDVDMDIEDAERPRAVQYLLSLFNAVQIGTWSKLGASYDEREDEERGSVLVTWLSSKRRECEETAKEALARKHAKRGDKPPTQAQVKAYATGIFNNHYGAVKDLRDVERVVSKEEYKALRELVTMNSVYKSYGVHAGGILLSGDKIKIEDYIPTMLVASSNTRVSQYDMDDVEQFGLLKMDVLGQAILRTMKSTLELAGMDDPTDFTWIPNNDGEACKWLRSGKVDTGIFHQEAPTKSRGGRELGIKSTKDCIMVQALYMPGAMESGQTNHFNRARRDSAFRNSITYVHPIFEKHLKETYGAYVFQNQVLSILRDMGMSIPDINMFLKVVKDSGAGAREANVTRLAGLREHFEGLWDELGIDREHLDETWEALCGFGAYGFNKAHAAGYGVRMYRSAYLKAHYPLEFHAALLQTWAGRKKETVYIREVRKMGLRLMKPDVNVSGANWSVDRKKNAIRRGLVSISGVGDATALAIAEQAPYESIEDMIAKLPGRALTGGKKFLDTGAITGVLQKLYDAGALETLMEEN